jgi:predicted O-methyltransferase YrrM
MKSQPHIDLSGILDWSYAPFEVKNPSSWLNDHLKAIYDATTGPHRSPDPVECFILYTLSKNSRGNVLELGSWKGRSSCFLAQGIKESGLPDRQLHCVDWFKGDNTGGQSPDLDAMKKSIDSFDLGKYIAIHNSDMLTFDYQPLSNIDLVFYDSDHNTKPTTSALNRICPQLNQGAIVCIHDASWKMTKDAIENVKNIFEHMITINVWCGFAILKKI